MSPLAHAIADTIEARAESGDPLSLDEMFRLAAALRSPVVPVQSRPACMVFKLVPGQAREERL